MPLDSSKHTVSSAPESRWRPPEGSRATRKISRRSKGSSRVTIVTTDNPREIRCESGLESKAAYVLLARPDRAELEEQPSPVKYLNLNGEPRRHWFDFLFIRTDGARIMVAVKPSKRARKHNFIGLLAHIASQMSRSVADGVLLLTEEHLGSDLVHNSVLIHESRRDPDADADSRIRALITTMSGAATVDSLVVTAGLDGEGFRAVVRAIADGLLVVRGSSRIDRATWVQRGPAAGVSS
jgi:hypothetical protein